VSGGTWAVTAEHAGSAENREFAAIGGGDALLDFADEPLVVVHHALHGFDYQRFAVAALLRCQLRELGLKIGTQVYFHEV